jgi:hypothetical protein
LGGVTAIGNSAFADCDKLTEVFFGAKTAPTLGSVANPISPFNNTSAVAYVPIDGTGYAAEAFRNNFDETPLISTAPSFTTNPVPQSSAVGKTASFSVVATGAPTPKLQWQLSTDDGATWTNIEGETNDTLVVTATDMSFNGYKYRCVATSALGSIESSAALHTVTLTTLSTLSIKAKDVTWTGKSITSGLKFTAKVNGKDVTLTVGKDIKLSNFKANKNIGKATVTLTAVAGSVYKDSKTVSFNIVPKSLGKPKVTVGKKQVKVSWKKGAKAQKLTGYKVQYRASGTTKWKTKTVKAKNASLVVKKLKKSKKYQVRIAAYKGAYTSTYSAIKTSAKVK